MEKNAKLQFLKLAILTWLGMVRASNVIQATGDMPPSDSVQKIPKIFHHIWFNFGKGDEVLPHYQRNMDELKVLHPEWEFKLWKKDEVIELIKQQRPDFLPTFLSYDVPIKQHDSARPIILKAFGGVYIDQDFLALKNLEPILKSYDFITGNEYADVFHPGNSVMAGIPQHPIYDLYVDRMKEPANAKKYVIYSTGPVMLTQVIREYVQQHGSDGIKVYASHYFYPIDWNNRSKIRKMQRDDFIREFPGSYLAQEFHGAWSY